MEASIHPCHVVLSSILNDIPNSKLIARESPCKSWTHVPPPLVNNQHHHPVLFGRRAISDATRGIKPSVPSWPPLETIYIASLEELGACPGTGPLTVSVPPIPFLLVARFVCSSTPARHECIALALDALPGVFYSILGFMGVQSHLPQEKVSSYLCGYAVDSGFEGLEGLIFTRLQGLWLV